MDISSELKVAALKEIRNDQMSLLNAKYLHSGVRFRARQKYNELFDLLGRIVVNSTPPHEAAKIERKRLIITPFGMALMRLQTFGVSEKTAKQLLLSAGE